jgi:nitrite reductase/ring-hydroxylating ferredoxin subunit
LFRCYGNPYVVECPLHFAQFDVRSGVLISGPVATDVPMYEVRVERETVYVKQQTNNR